MYDIHLKAAYFVAIIIGPRTFEATSLLRNSQRGCKVEDHIKLQSSWHESPAGSRCVLVCFSLGYHQ